VKNEESDSAPNIISLFKRTNIIFVECTQQENVALERRAYM
jgi:hypothetical protein